MKIVKYFKIIEIKVLIFRKQQDQLLRKKESRNTTYNHTYDKTPTIICISMGKLFIVPMVLILSCLILF